jgi:hypothetical protein
MIQVAISHGMGELVKELIERGVKLETTDNEQRDSWAVAIGAQQHHILQQIFTHESFIARLENLLIRCIEYDSWNCFAVMLQEYPHKILLPDVLSKLKITATKCERLSLIEELITSFTQDSSLANLDDILH